MGGKFLDFWEFDFAEIGVGKRESGGQENGQSDFVNKLLQITSFHQQISVHQGPQLAAANAHRTSLFVCLFVLVWFEDEK